MSIATNESWIDKKTGEKRTHTEWHDVVFYNKMAEVIRDCLKKGRHIYISGSVKTRLWEDDEKQKHYKKEIIGCELIMLGIPNHKTN